MSEFYLCVWVCEIERVSVFARVCVSEWGEFCVLARL